jgi:transcriptional/translational regulatory protein YebC/TACO1
VVADSHVAEQVLGLLEALEDHDDVQVVHANLELSPDLASKAG